MLRQSETAPRPASLEMVDAVYNELLMAGKGRAVDIVGRGYRHTDEYTYDGLKSSIQTDQPDVEAPLGEGGKVTSFVAYEAVVFTDHGMTKTEGGDVVARFSRVFGHDSECRLTYDVHADGTIQHIVDDLESNTRIHDEPLNLRAVATIVDTLSRGRVEMAR